MSHVRLPQTSRLGLRGVRSTFVMSASNQTMSAASSGSIGQPARERQRARQEVHPEVQARAGLDEVLDLGIGLGRGQCDVDVDDHELGHRQPERAPELARDDLRHERLLALPRAAELRDVHAVVVGLHEPRQRAALAQGLDVAGGGDGAQRLEHGAQLGRAGRSARGFAAAVASPLLRRRAPVALPGRGRLDSRSWSRSRSATSARRRAGRWTARGSIHREAPHPARALGGGQAGRRRPHRAGAAHRRQAVYDESAAILAYADEHTPAQRRLYPAEARRARGGGRARAALRRRARARGAALALRPGLHRRQPLRALEPHGRAGLGAAHVPLRAGAGQAS